MNQDHFLVASLHKSMRLHQTTLPNDGLGSLVSGARGYVFLVADGVGSTPWGEQASGSALRAIADYVLHGMDLEAVPDTVRALVFASLIGDAPASLYDLRRELDEQILEWSPVEAAARARRRTTDAGDPAPTLEAVGEDWVAMARAGRLPPTVGVDPVYDQLGGLLYGARVPSLLFVGPRGAGKTALVRISYLSEFCGSP